MTYLITKDEAAELAKYMLDNWSAEGVDYDSLRADIDYYIDCEANGRKYTWKNTPSNYACDIVNDIIDAGSYEFEEDEE